MTRQAIKAEKEQEIQKKQVTKAVWFITLRCNFKCNYCHAEQVNDPLLRYPFEPAEKWIEAWNRIDGEVLIDVTGGEPFIHPGFLDIVTNLDPSKRVAITSNLKADITGFVQKVTPEKCFSVTVSLHPSQKMNVEYFLGKCLLLKNRGFNVQVNFVAFPEQMWMADYYKNLVEGVGIRFHTDPYTPGPVYPFTPTEKEKKFLSRFFGVDRDDPYNRKVFTYLCDAGMNNFVVSPDGQVSSCVSRIYSQAGAMGNIFDADFKLLDKPMVCNSNFCSGCDADKITRIVIDEKEVSETNDKAG
ncbi:MAG: hypothetical protein ACYTG7_15170 [Planctomycetota bacterium]|jgi:MoaA/NifB/PqqE/SkfB family radical SAM enzyme